MSVQPPLVATQAQQPAPNDEAGTRASLDTSVTQSPELEQAAEVVDGPAKVVLSSQEFHFGDVVMSQGVVSRTLDVTNSGTGMLYIQGVAPT